MSVRMKSNPEPSTQEVLAGLVERVTFHNPENGFCVLRAKARGHRDLVTVVGHAAVISAVVRLTEVFRQAAASRIIVNAPRINQGLMPDLSAPAGNSDFYFVPAQDPETAVQRILELVKTRIPKRFGLNAIRDIQVLCPMNRGGVGARSLNIQAQAALNPLANARSSVSARSSLRATRSCRSRMTTTRRSTTAISATSSTSMPTRASSWRASTDTR